MNGDDFVKLCFDEKGNTLKHYFDEDDATEGGKRINALVQTRTNKSLLYYGRMIY
ncbi:MAG: hypothetical protein SOV68_04115 [Ligilactobacillus salivarius]|nr:hypothetical protein [Ligilactobacillus salivarius]